MKTNSKQVREKIRLHILDCVTDDYGNTYATFEEAAARLRNEFNRVANHPHNLRRFPNAQYRFHDYLMGIPFDFEFMDHKITEFLESLEINPDGEEYDAEKSASLYSYLIFKEI